VKLKWNQWQNPQPKQRKKRKILKQKGPGAVMFVEITSQHQSNI
jgi:hypothetical protein